MSEAAAPRGPIMVAMSGGVDSSVSAALLLSQGYAVVGAFMLLSQTDGPEQVERVRAIARRLGIRLEVVDLRAEFTARVLDYFIDAYRQGRTPNPCVVCNRTIKFGLLRAAGRRLGIEAMATGHYARAACDPDGRVRLLCGRDLKKDQSYFLCGLSPPQLAGVSFPLGETSKAEVYRIAAELGLTGLHGEESQDVCFLKGRDLATFFAAAGLPACPGELVTANGEVKGRHQGIQHYTVGQRRGLGVPDATPYYVTGLDAAHNRVLLGKAHDLWAETLTVADMHWLAGEAPSLPQAFQVKIRYRHQAAPAVVSFDAGRYLVRFASPQRAITPGQFAALYQGEELIGGGAIL